MKVTIIGDATRAVAWEKHLRPHKIVQEVILIPSVEDLGSGDAVILIDDGPENLDKLLKLIQKGYNSFLVSDIPTDAAKLEKIHRASREAGVQVQVSHWPSLASASQWMMDEMNRPSLISITREVNYNQLTDPETEFRHHWMDELGFCLKWINGGIHHIEAREVRLAPGHPVILHLFLRFDNGSSSDIRIYSGASENLHQRIASNRKEFMECQVASQNIRIGRLNDSGLLYFERQNFDPAKSAEKAALMFLKAVQMGKEPPYTAFDAWQLALQIQKVRQRLENFG
ncbi:hypothetical protein AB2B38_007935 [Balneola sp. MJW-20]|uniref:hypothetical protein n=1 Tax=Gracilimonas aurantiaca TaxID=3234185 RepID=UPI003464FD90